MNEAGLNEADTRAELIDPALKQAGWGVVEASRVRREVITLGRLQGGGKRARQDIADYVLIYRGQKLAVIEAENSDLYDVLAYIAFNMAPVTRAERVDAHKARILHGHDYRQREFLSFVLDHYVARGVSELDMAKLPQLIELKYHSLGDAVQELGPAGRIREVFVDFQQYLY